MLILAFPVVIFIGLFLQDIAAWRTVGWIPAAAAIVIIAWQAADLWLLRKYEFASALSRERVALLTAAAAIAPGRPLAFGTRPDDLWYNHQIDSVLAAQELGVPTLNGYSGALPPGAAMTMSCTGAQLMLQSYDVWAKEHGLRRLNDMGVDAAPIGMGECDLSRQTIVAMPTSTSGRSLNAKNARLVALSDLTVAPGDPATVSVLVTNGSPRVIHQRARHPLRLSWSTDQSPGVRYDNRIELGGDLAPVRREWSPGTCRPERGLKTCRCPSSSRASSGCTISAFRRSGPCRSHTADLRSATALWRAW
jgi:hypothetical protein